MSRRDIIIIAVLINAGLLIVLFTSALKSGSEQDSAQFATSEVQKEAEVAFRKETPTAGDEVDQVLREFSRPQTPLASVATPSPMPTEVSQERKSSFADDLGALTTPAASPEPFVMATTPAPLPPAPSEETLAGNFVEVKVKKGDVLEKIAKTHHCSVDEIMKVNHLANSRLKIGQVLKVPQGSKKAPASSVAVAKSAQPKYYTVKNGDNPWTIAVKNHIKVEQLLKLNNMDADKARKLKPGDQLRIE